MLNYLSKFHFPSFSNSIALFKQWYHCSNFPVLWNHACSQRGFLNNSADSFHTSFKILFRAWEFAFLKYAPSIFVSNFYFLHFFSSWDFYHSSFLFSCYPLSPCVYKISWRFWFCRHIFLYSTVSLISSGHHLYSRRWMKITVHQRRKSKNDCPGTKKTFNTHRQKKNRNFLAANDYSTIETAGSLSVGCWLCDTIWSRNIYVR